MDGKGEMVESVCGGAEGWLKRCYSYTATTNQICLFTAYQRRVQGVVFLNITGPRHSDFDKAFVAAWGISRGSFMTWMVVWFFFSAMKLETHSLDFKCSPFLAFENTHCESLRV